MKVKNSWGILFSFIYGLTGCVVFCNYLVNMAIFEKKIYLTINVLRLLLKLLSETFFIKVDFGEIS
jgi:hypothetical protein